MNTLIALEVARVFGRRLFSAPSLFPYKILFIPSVYTLRAGEVMSLI